MASRFAKKIGVSRLMAAWRDKTGRPSACESSEASTLSGPSDRLTKIHVVSPAHLDKLIQHLQRGDYKHVKRLQLSISPFGVPSRHWKVSRFFSVLGFCLDLEEVIFKAGHDGTLFLPITAVISLLQRSSGSLRKLEFDRCTFLTKLSTLGAPKKQEDLYYNEDHLRACIRQLKRLESLEVNKCWLNLHCLGHLSKQKKCPCHPMIAALTSLPNLKRLVARSPAPRFSQLKTKHILQLLISCPLLEELELKDSESDFGALAPVLKGQKSLRRLILGSCELDPSGETALLEWLSSNPPLQELEFHPNLRGGDCNNFYAHRMPYALRWNTNLKRLIIRERTRTRSIPFDVQVCWLECVKDHNFVLEDFGIVAGPDCPGSSQHYCDPSLQREMEYYLRLNRLGRRRLEQNCDLLTGSEIVQTLEKAAEDVSCLYYILRTNPAVCRVR